MTMKAYLNKFALVLSVLLYTTTALAASAPNIVVSIKPFYNICAKVMESVGTPHLILNNNSSPHDYQLKPSDAKLINNADLLIWGGPDVESYLTKPVSSLANRNLDLAAIPNLELLPIRTATNWQHDHEHGHDHDHDHGHSHNHDHGTTDPHYWLDPDNAVIIALAIADRLSEIDPTHAQTYAKNATAFAKKINQDKKIWTQKLAPYKKEPYVVAHDAYQYFNNYFGLDGVGSITLNPEVPPSIQRVQQIQQLLIADKVHCIFSEPQYNYKIFDSLIKDTKVHVGRLDPLGQDADLGPNGYFKLMDDLVHNFVACNKS